MTQPLSADCQQHFRIAVKLILGVRRHYDGQHAEHHALVTICEIVQEVLALAALHLHVKRNGGGEIVIVVLPPLPVCDVGFHAEQTVFHLAHRFVHRDRDNVDGQHHACADVGKLGDDVVLDEVGVVPQEDHSAVAVAHAEEVPPRLKAIGADIVLEVVSLARHVLRVEVEIRFLLRAKEVVDQLQLFCGVHFLAAGAEPRKISGKLAADAVEIVTRLLNVVLVRAYG